MGHKKMMILKNMLYIKILIFKTISLQDNLQEYIKMIEYIL